MPRLVIVESPYAGDVERNTRYAYACMRDALSRGEAPLASHLLFPQFLDDTIPEERNLGMHAGLAWVRVAHATVVYADLGISRGMAIGIEKATRWRRYVELRLLGGEWATEADSVHPRR